MKKTKNDLLSGYKTYDPKTEGYGSPNEWKKSFRQRMGIDEARTILSEDNPYTILGVAITATFEEVKKAYRTLAKLNHPDKHQDEVEKYTELFKKIIAAYTVLENKLKK